MSATQHSILGASSAHRWIECPGSIPLGEPLPEPEQSYFAAEGTAAHALGEKCLKERADPAFFKGLNIVVCQGTEERFFPEGSDMTWVEDEEQKTHSFEVDDEMIAAVQVYIDECYRTIDELSVRDKAGKITAKPLFMIEKNFSLEFVRPEMFGTGDFTAFRPGVKLTVIDYKHGAGYPVEVEDNDQAMYYALGALRELCWDEKKGEWVADLMPTEVELVIVQPRARHANGPVRRWVVDPWYLIEDFAARIGDAADRVGVASNTLSSVNDPDAEAAMTATEWEKVFLSAGDHCKFCKAKGVCPALRAKAFETFKTAFDDFDPEDLIGLPKKDAEERAKRAGREGAAAIIQQGREKLSETMLLLPLIEEFARGIAAATQGELEAGRTVEVFKLVRSKTNRKVLDEAKALEDLTLYADEDDLLTERKLKSAAQLEKVPGVPQSVIDEHFKKPTGRLTVAHESDPRPPVVIASLATTLEGELSPEDVEDELAGIV